MKILLLHQFFLGKNEGGGSRFNEMTRIWAELGHRITVLAGMVHYTTGKKREEYKGRYTATEQIDSRITVIRSHVSTSYNANFAGRLWAYFSFMFSSLYAGLFKVSQRPDIILVTSPPLFVGLTAFILSRIKRVPYIFEVRDLWPESAIETGVLKSRILIRLSYSLESFLYRHAKLINVLTPAFRDYLIEKKKIAPEKIIFIPNAADFALSDEILATLSRDTFRKENGLDGKTVILYVGAHGVANHLIQVLQTAELLKEDLPDVLFLLIGEGMEKPMLKQYALQNELTNVRFLDGISKAEVFNYIIASDIGSSVLKKADIFKTIYSNKTFDYMACKKPVLMLIDGISRALVEEAKCGVYAEPENPHDFTEKIKMLKAMSPEELNRMGENGYAYVKKHFDRDVLAREYINHLAEAAGGSIVYQS